MLIYIIDDAFRRKTFGGLLKILTVGNSRIDDKRGSMFKQIFKQILDGFIWYFCRRLAYVKTRVQSRYRERD